MAADRTLTTRELGRAVLARQLLLERATLPIPAALERVAGLQAQYAPSPYIGLWSRLDGFSRDALTAALGSREVAQGTLMRSTIHLVSASDYPYFAAGTRPGRRDWLLRVQGRRLDGIDMDAVAERLRHHLAAGPRRQAELLALLESEGHPRLAWSGAREWVDMVRIPPSGTWDRRRADIYALAEDWLGPASVAETEGLERLVRRYLAGFGPASLRDTANWAGLPLARVVRTAERLDLMRFRDEGGVELVDLPGSPLPAADVPAPVRFLPTWDATLLAHARRSGILPERYRPRVFATRTPHSFPTFLVDGTVAGTWRHAGDRIAIEPFERLEPDARHELEAEAERLAAFHAA